MQVKNRFIKYLGWALAALLLLALFARLMLAPLASGAIESWFEDRGVTARVDDLGFELVDGRAALGGLTASAGGKQVLALASLDIAWSWPDLRDNRLRIDSIRIDGLEFDVERLEDGGMIIAGIDLPATAPGQDDAAREPGEPLDWTLQLPRFVMTNTRLCYLAPPQLDYCNQLANLEWNGSLQFELAKLGDEALPLLVDGEFRLAGFESRSNELQRVLASFESFAFEGIAVDTGDDVSLGAVTLEALNLFERSGDEDGGFIEHIDRVQVNEVRLDRGDLLTIAEVLVEGNATDFVKTEADRYEIAAWLADLGLATEPTGEATPEAQASGGNAESAAGVAVGNRRTGVDTEPATGRQAGETEAAAVTVQPGTAPDPQPAGNFHFAVGKLVFESDNPLRYRDLTFDKPFAVGLSSTRLVVESLDSRQPERPSNISYEAKPGGDSLFEIAGTVTPLAAKISFDLGGEIRALDLRQLSPFTAAHIGHTIRSGQLDADLALRAEQAIVNGKIDLVLYHFDLAPLSAEDAAAMEARFGFPLKTSLSLLKNRAGNIELEVPLTGDLASPDFGTGKIITRELSKAITSAVLTFYTPFGLVSAADALFSLATALEFDPVEFAAGGSEIEQAEAGDLDQIATLMQERPGIQIRLCPHTNTADRVALLPDTARKSADDIKAEDMPALDELGEARILAVEQYLAGKQIDPARLIHCAPTHEEGEGLAGVELTI